MVKLRRSKKADQIRVFADGAIRPAAQRCGLGVVVLDRNGRLIAWLAKTTGPLTNNEAEYEAIIFALEQITHWRPAAATLFSDSKVVVDQVQGRAIARSPGMKCRLARVREILSGQRPINFRHIPRGRNRLADALANDVVDGFVKESRL